jgi:flagellar biosynthetic protein FliQ
MEAKMVGLGMEMFKIVLLMSMPILMVAMIVGLLISIFQATTQINEMTLSFVPKVLAVIAVLLFVMPWMLESMVNYTEDIFNSIPTFLF